MLKLSPIPQQGGVSLSAAPKPMTYKATYLMMGKKHTAEGDSAAEAISNLKLKALRAKGILAVEHGEERRERVIMPQIASRLFNTVGLSREVALKNMALMFDGI